MFKKVLVSVALGTLLLVSLSLWAKGNHEKVQKPVLVAKLEVGNQLSISAHQGGQEGYLDQLGPAREKVVSQQNEAGLPMPVASVFWIMLFGLLFFVIRGAARRIK